MNIDIFDQQVRQDFLQRIRVAGVDVEDLLAFCEQRNQCFLVENEKGVLGETIRRGNWVYQELDPNSNTLHPKAERYLDEVLEAGFPIRQIIYGYEIAEVQVKPRPKPHIQVSDRTVETVTSLAKAALLVTAGVAMLVGYAFLAGLSAIDPKLIVVLDTGAEEKDLPWVCLMSWEAKSEES